MNSTEEKTTETTIETTIETTEQTKKTLSDIFEQALSQGKSKEEALQMIVAEASKKVSSPRRDNIQFIQSLTSIPEVRKAKKVAYAKVSKSKDKPEAVARYQLEIQAADKRLNELLSEVNQAKEPWKKAMELGEDAKGAVTYFIQGYKEEIDKKLEKAVGKMTKSEVKAALLKITPTVPADLPEVLKDVASERVHNQDMMLITIFRKVNFLSSGVKTSGKKDEKKTA